MGKQVILQPNGKLALFSTNSDTWHRYDCTPEELIDYFAAMAEEDARRSAIRTIAQVLAYENPYYQFALSFEEANEMSKAHGGITIGKDGGIAEDGG